ncbi:MAG: hypothetical protein ACYDA2_02655 [Acidimicrobiales bacterium]
MSFASQTAPAPNAVGADVTVTGSAQIAWSCQASTASDTGWLEAVRVNSQSSQLNLSNALIAAVDLYQRAETYDATEGATSTSETGAGGLSTVTALKSADPSYSWVAGSTACTTSSVPCISAEPIDVSASNDGQGIVLAAYGDNGTCWYVANLQVAPVAIWSSNQGTPYAFVTAGNSPTDNGSAILRAGTYYAEKLNVGSTNCKADYALSAPAFKWFDSFGQVAATN